MSSVICDVKDGIMWITLNNTQKYNMLDSDMRNRIFECLSAAGERDDISVVVLTNSGNIFSLGADLELLHSLSKGSEYSIDSFLFNQGIASLGSVIRKLDKPVIAVVNGYCINGGFELVQYCDLIYASEDSVFGHLESELNLIPGGGGTQNLPRFIGEKKAKEMMFLGKLITAKEAKEMGIINDVLPKDKLYEYVLGIIEKLKTKDRRVLALLKKSINLIYDVPFSSGIDYERKMFAELLTSEDTRKRLEEVSKNPNVLIRK